MPANNRRSRTGMAPQTIPPRTSGSARFHQAKDLLTEWFGVSPGQAEDLLLNWSCETKTSACELATALVSDIYQGRPTGCSAEVLRHLERRLRDLSNANAVSDPPRDEAQIPRETLPEAT
jgi:hypothetical protein